MFKSDNKYRIIYALIKPYRIRYTFVTILSMIVGVLGGISIAALFPLLNTLLNVQQPQEQGRLLLLVQDMVNLIPFENKIVTVCVFMLLAIIIKTFTAVLLEYLIASSGAKVVYNIKKSIFERYAGAPYQFFLDNKQGELTYNIHMAPEKVSDLLTILPKLMARVFNTAVFLIILLSISIQATGVILAFMFVFYMIANYVARTVSFPIGIKKRKRLVEQQITINEFINGIKQIFVFQAKRKWSDYFDRSSKRYKKLRVRAATWLAIPENFLELLMFIAIAVTAVVLNDMYPDGFVNHIPAIGIYVISLQKLLQNVAQFNKFHMIIMEVLPNAQICYDSMHVNTDPPDIRENSLNEFKSLSGPISFENVSFSYEGRNDLLKNINTVFEKEKLSAIIGASGEGKTTIINLILGLYSPTSGSIKIDGIDLRDYKKESWLNKIGFVSQETFIFHSTIADNISFGSKDYSSEEIIKAARIANAHDFIQEFPDGYNTVVGERGMKLSGGQQQRIALARAILRNPEILILDEATSSLDTISEKQVQTAINNISGNRTVVVIAHRLSTIKNADKIIVLNDGKIAEEGTHSELLNKEGYYWNLYKLQGLSGERDT